MADAEASSLLENAGAKFQHRAVLIPGRIIDHTLDTVGRDFFLYTRPGDQVLHYSVHDEVHFDPGSCAFNILDPETGRENS